MTGMHSPHSRAPAHACALVRIKKRIAASLEGIPGMSRHIHACAKTNTLRYAFVGVTVEDLYPRDDWNFVFGLADPLGRTSVFSFARYADEGFLNAKAAQARLLKRAVKVMAHEIGHTFGLMHCIHYSCLMQGSISAEESDAKPHELCPLCLRKLFFSTEFGPVLRYEALIEWIEALDGGPDLFAADSGANEAVFGEWKAWYRRRIDACG